MTTFEAALLPDEEKERLCRSLLAEFGATQVRPSGDAELIHSCVLPFRGHKNNDANPSASLNYKKLTYNCLGCGNSGGLLWFIGVCRGTTGNEARKWLNDQTGAGPDEQSLSSLLQFFDAVYSKPTQKPPPMPRMDPRILESWLFIHPYLTDVRGIPEANIKQFRVGWNPEADRIVIPHFWKGTLVGWQTRRLQNDGTPKYQSSPDMPKDRTLYGNPPGEHVVVVESPMTVLSKWHVCPDLIATFGASVTDRQVKLLSMYRRITLWFDNDEAGWNATQHVGEMLEPYSDVWVVDSSWAADAADLHDDEVRWLVNECRVPFSVWQQPSELRKLEVV